MSGAVINLDPVVPQGADGIGEIIGAHHQAAWENTYAAFQNAHIYVHFKAVYTLALKQGLGERDGCHIGGSQYLFHTI